MPAPEIDTGTLLGGTYQITHKLGQGGMSAVWAANHMRLPGKRAAVKVLLGAAPSSEAFTRFRREAEIVSRIGHPNIVEVFDFDVLPSGVPYIVLELLDGEDLDARLRRGPLPLETALGLMRQIASAVRAAHHAGVVHRDLKPANIFLCPSDEGDRIKVLDFGISKIQGSSTLQTAESVLIGTPQYMSPEQATGRNQQVDARTDVFALGAIGYEMLSGRPAFTGETLAAVIFKVVYEPAPPLPGVPAPVAAAIERALAKDPAARFGDVDSFMDALTGRPLGTRPSLPGVSATVIGVPASGAMEVATAPAAAAAAPTLAAETAAAAAAPTPEPASAAAAIATPALEGAGVATTRRSRSLLIVVTALLLGAGGVAAWQLRARHGSANGNVNGNANANGNANVNGNANANGNANVSGNANGKVPPAHVAEPPAPSPVAPHPRHHAPASNPPHAVAESLPPAVAADLHDAQAALDQGNLHEALRLARHSLELQRTAAALAFIARAYCHAGDLGNARAALYAVARRDRSSVLAACKRAGVDLE